MQKKRMANGSMADPHTIVFGFDRDTDERSLKLFLRRFTDRQVMDVLVPRLQESDIPAMVDFLTALMRKHLSEEEYHRLFLAE